MTDKDTSRLSAVPRARIAATLAAALFMITYGALYAAVDNDVSRGEITTLFTTVAAAAALAGAIWAERRVIRENHSVWVAMLVSTTCFAAGWVYRFVVVLRTADYPYAGSLEDLLFSVGFLALVPAVLLMTQPRQGVRLTQVRQALDLSSIALAALAGLALLLLIPLQLIGAQIGIAASIAFAVYVATTSALVVYLLAFKRTRWSSSEALVLAGLVCALLGMLASVSALNRYKPDDMWAAVPNSLFTAGFLFFALAGVHAATRFSVLGRRGGATVMVPRWTQHVSTAVAFIGLPWLIIAAAQADSPFTHVFLSAVAVALTLTLAGRNLVMNAENRQMAQRAIHDPLTGLHNERHLHERVAEELRRADSQDTDTCVCLLIIDGHESRVEAEGFSAMDSMIKTVARRIEAIAGLSAAYRVGADRFALLLASTNAVEAYQICAEIAKAVETAESGAGATLSAGIASARLTTHEPETLIRYARGAAYWASSTGGNRIVLFDPEVVTAMDSAMHIARIEEQSHTRLLEALAAAVDARDPYTRYHSANVARLSEGFGRYLKMPKEQVRRIREAAIMHDLGKIGIADSVLMKPDLLTAEEYDIIKSHPELGARILSSGSNSEIIAWVRAHHERWDGRGYPDGLSGESIPYEARVLAVCDAYDAMTSDRPYRSGLSVSEAIEELRGHAGSQFDPQLIEPFIEGLFEMWPETGGRSHQLGAPKANSDT